MNECEKYALLMTDAVDDLPGARENEDLKLHLASCPDCRRLYEDMRSLASLCDGLDAEPPYDLHERIIGAVNAERKADLRRRAKVFRISALAACAALVIAAVGFAGDMIPGRFTKDTAVADIAKDAFFYVSDEAGINRSPVLKEESADEPMLDAAAYGETKKGGDMPREYAEESMVVVRIVNGSEFDQAEKEELILEDGTQAFLLPVKTYCELVESGAIEPVEGENPSYKDAGEEALDAWIRIVAAD